DGPVDAELTARAYVPVRLRAPAGEASTDPELMAAADERHVVADLPRGRDDVGRRFGAGAEDEAPGDVEQHVVIEVAVAVDTDFRRGEKADVRARDVRAVDRKADGVQRGRTDDVVLADREAVRHVVAAADARRQHVL